MSEEKSGERRACPLLSIGAGGEALIECIEEDCMFWIPEKKNCAIVVLAKKLTE